MKHGLFCIMTGAEADRWGVCPEHGETACVVGARRQVIHDRPWWKRLFR